jgi:phycobilisome core-membrane linker protein
MEQQWGERGMGSGPSPGKSAANICSWVPGEQGPSRNVNQQGTLPFMSVTASSGSTRVAPQLYDTLPLSSVRRAEQQDRFPDGGELDALITFFQSGQTRVEAARRISANAGPIVARAANRIFIGGTPLSYLDAPLAGAEEEAVPLAADQKAFRTSIQTFVQGSGGKGLLGRVLEGVQADADVRVVLPSGFNPIAVGVYGTDRMRKSLRDMAWFLRYVGYALVAGDPSILAVNTRGLRDVLEKACSLAATNVALQEMRAAAAGLFREQPEARQLVIDYFNVLLKELEVPTPSTRQRLGSPVNQGLQLPAIYALSAGGAQRFVMRTRLSGPQKAEVIRAAYRQVFERDIVKGYSQVVCAVEATQVRQGQLSMREFIRALGRSNEYRRQFYGRFSNSRVVELAFRHFLGRGVSSIEEFRRYFAIVSEQGLNGLVDCLVNGMEYARVFGEETVPYLRDLGEEAQESAGWGSNRKLFRFSAPFEGAPQYITLYASYRQPLPDQHSYGGGNDPIGLTYGAIFPSGTASVATRPVPFSYDNRRLLIGNGMAQPGPMNSKQFRKAVPRRVGPTVKTLRQISTGGSSVPRRGGQPSLRGTESSTQAVIRAVYVQVLGTIGYAGERNTVEEIKLENGDISLREFVRQVARSNAFRRRYWSGLYITKAIEVMHRRILGRPTFGRWEINAYFDTAARKGFYGVVDAMLESQEYNDCFGEDTVPYERFITPADRNARRVPALRRPLDTAAVADLTPVQRPQVSTPRPLRTVGDLVPRNLPGRPRVVRGSWSANVSGVDTAAAQAQPSSAPSASVRSLPAPTRSWVWTPPAAQPAGLSRPTTSPSGLPSGRAVPTAFSPLGGVQWQAAIGNGFAPANARQPGSAMEQALRPAAPQGFARRRSLSRPVQLPAFPSEEQLREAIEITYRQLLNRVPFSAERLRDAESQLRDRQLTVAEFVSQIACSELFQQRLTRMAPLRAASAAHLALLGRAAQPGEVSRFLATRAQEGQRAAINQLLDSEEYASAFGRDTVPYLRGMDTSDGLPLSTVNRTASLYGGNAGLTPSPQGAI